mgnify:CR=1 FL=1
MGDVPGEAEPIDDAELAQLRSEITGRMQQTQRILTDARKRADAADAKAKTARNRGEEETAAAATKTADAERARMHEALRELAELQSEIDKLSTVEAAPKAKQARRSAPQARRQGGGTSTRVPRQSVDELLDQLKNEAGSPGAGRSKSQKRPPRGAAKSTQKKSSGSSVDDELAALKRKMQNQKRRK